MIKCLEAGDDSDSDCESMEIYDELSVIILVNNLYQMKKCIICLYQKTCEEVYKCTEFPMILCLECSSVIVINYYGNKKHEHPLKISNKDNCKCCKCNNCKKKI